MSAFQLTSEQRQELEADLVTLEEYLAAILESTEAGARPVNLKSNIGRLSRMDEMHNQSILKANRNVITSRLQKTRRALHRIRDGAYGECDDCGEVINYARLKAYPDSTLCILCQSARETGK